MEADIDLLNKDNESVEGEQLHRQVQERAKTLGVKIIYTGEKVWESHISKLMDTILWRRFPIVSAMPGQANCM